MMHKILVVDDEADICDLVVGLLEDEGWKAHSAAHSDLALKYLEEMRIDLVILDIWLQGSRLDGLELLSKIHSLYPSLPVIVISGHANIDLAVRAIQEGACDFLEKPFKADRLFVTVRRALESLGLKKINHALKEQLYQACDLIGNSFFIRQLRDVFLPKIANLDARIMITGPRGSGKKALARAIHATSKKNTTPFWVIGANQLLKFTHLFEIDEGSIVIDALETMDLDTQSQLLLALQGQHPDWSIGSLRILAVCGQGMEAQLACGQFRAGLWDRLSAIKVEIPPLHHRKEDIGPLLAHFSNAHTCFEVAPDALAALQSYSWPGNVQQLKQVIEWVSLLFEDRPSDWKLHAHHLPQDIGSGVPSILYWEHAKNMMNMSLKDAREVFEREYLSVQLLRFAGNVSRVASHIGMERAALHRKLKVLGITTDQLRNPQGSVDTET